MEKFTKIIRFLELKLAVQQVVCAHPQELDEKWLTDAELLTLHTVFRMLYIFKKNIDHLESDKFVTACEVVRDMDDLRLDLIKFKVHDQDSTGKKCVLAAIKAFNKRVSSTIQIPEELEIENSASNLTTCPRAPHRDHMLYYELSDNDDAFNPYDDDAYEGS